MARSIEIGVLLRTAGPAAASSPPLAGGCAFRGCDGVEKEAAD